MSDTSEAARAIADDILRQSAEELDAFIDGHLRRKSLHDVVSNLNRDVLSKEPVRRRKAERALGRLGFV